MKRIIVLIVLCGLAGCDSKAEESKQDHVAESEAKADSDAKPQAPRLPGAAMVADDAGRIVVVGQAYLTSHILMPLMEPGSGLGDLLARGHEGDKPPSGVVDSWALVSDDNQLPVWKRIPDVQGVVGKGDSAWLVNPRVVHVRHDTVVVIDKQGHVLVPNSFGRLAALVKDSKGQPVWKRIRVAHGDVGADDGGWLTAPKAHAISGPYRSGYATGHDAGHEEGYEEGHEVGMDDAHLTP